MRALQIGGFPSLVSLQLVEKGVRNLAPGNLSESSRFRENGSGYGPRYEMTGHSGKPARRKMAR